MPSKKISYQAKLKQKIQQEKISAITDQKKANSVQAIHKPPTERIFGCFVLICILVGAGVMIGIDAADKNNDTPNTNTPINTTDNTSTSNTATPYQISGSVNTIHGTSYTLSSFQGKMLILYFTGASCIPCKAQLPYLVSAYNQYKSTNKVDVISFDIQGKTIQELETWESENGITWKVCQDTGLTFSTRFSIYSMPTLVICDENGNEINRYVGAQSQETINTIFQNAV